VWNDGGELGPAAVECICGSCACPGPPEQQCFDGAAPLADVSCGPTAENPWQCPEGYTCVWSPYGTGLTRPGPSGSVGISDACCPLEGGGGLETAEGPDLDNTSTSTTGPQEEQQCDGGAPLADVFCGRGNASLYTACPDGSTCQACPDGYTCVLHPAAAWAVCCPIPAETEPTFPAAGAAKLALDDLGLEAAAAAAAVLLAAAP
jgi:hypothetical protein